MNQGLAVPHYTGALMPCFACWEARVFAATGALPEGPPPPDAKFLARPWCDCRDDRDRHLPPSAFGASNPGWGLITALQIAPGVDNTVLARATGGPVGVAPGIEGLAADALAEHAIRRALHEALERYALFCVPPSAYRPIARRLLNNMPADVPDHHLWIGVDGQPGDSDGTALDANPRYARDRAVIERIERYAVADALAGRTQPGRIEGDAVQGLVVLPAVAAWVTLAYLRGTTVPYCALGLGAGTTLSAARLCARRELSLVRHAFKNAGIAAGQPVGSPHDILFARAALDAILPDNLASWLGKPAHVDPDRVYDIPAEIERHFPQAWAVDITPPDLAELGLHVMRAGLD